jgi:hypothetical protein
MPIDLTGRTIFVVAPFHGFQRYADQFAESAQRQYPQVPIGRFGNLVRVGEVRIRRVPERAIWQSFRGISGPVELVMSDDLGGYSADARAEIQASFDRLQAMVGQRHERPAPKLVL